MLTYLYFYHHTGSISILYRLVLCWFVCVTLYFRCFCHPCQTTLGDVQGPSANACGTLLPTRTWSDKWRRISMERVAGFNARLGRAGCCDWFFFFAPPKKIKVLFSTYTYIMYRVPWVFVGATNCVTLNHWQPRLFESFWSLDGQVAPIHWNGGYHLLPRSIIPLVHLGYQNYSSIWGWFQTNCHMNLYESTYMYIYIYIFLYMYIWNERSKNYTSFAIPPPRWLAAVLPCGQASSDPWWIPENGWKPLFFPMGFLTFFGNLYVSSMLISNYNTRKESSGMELKHHHLVLNLWIAIKVHLFARESALKTSVILILIPWSSQEGKGTNRLRCEGKSISILAEATPGWRMGTYLGALESA